MKNLLIAVVAMAVALGFVALCYFLGFKILLYVIGAVAHAIKSS